MLKCQMLLKLVRGYNESHGRAHDIVWLHSCATTIGATLDIDGWYINGVVHNSGYYPA